MAPKPPRPEANDCEHSRRQQLGQLRIRETSQDAAFDRASQVVRTDHRSQIRCYETDPSLPPRDGKCHFFRPPIEIRAIVYDLVFAGVKQANLQLKYGKGSTPGRNEHLVCFRRVNQQIATETFRYLFPTFDVGWMLTGSSPEHSAGLLKTMRGRWACIHEFETASLYIPRKRMANVSNPVFWDAWDHTEYADAIRLRANWENLSWPVADRNVHTLTILQAEEFDRERKPSSIKLMTKAASLAADSSGNDLLTTPSSDNTKMSDFLVYLALFTKYFPELRQLRLKRCRYVGLTLDRFIERCRIEGREVKEWDGHQTKWTMPELAFFGETAEALADDTPVHKVGKPPYEIYHMYVED